MFLVRMWLLALWKGPTSVNTAVPVLYACALDATGAESYSCLGPALFQYKISVFCDRSKYHSSHHHRPPVISFIFLFVSFAGILGLNIK